MTDSWEESTRLSVLSLLNSTQQLYSGIGRALFEHAKRVPSDVDLEFVIDDLVPENVDLLRQFCTDHGRSMSVFPGSSGGYLDSVNLGLAEFLGEARWDVIECVGWASAATNGIVAANAGDAVIAYTPHYQPSWTVPMSPSQAKVIDAALTDLLQRADVVFCDSPWELAALRQRGSGRARFLYVPLGCDFQTFSPGPLERRRQLLFVGDLREPRKRFDRVLTVFAEVLAVHADARLLVIGTPSHEGPAAIPSELSHACEVRGYVSEAELLEAYRESLGLVLLSEYEAFGLPILEAVASGTPAFVTTMPSTESLFGDFDSVHFCPVEDLTATAAIIRGAMADTENAVATALRDRSRVADSFDWSVLATQRWQAVFASWGLRHLFQ